MLGKREFSMKCSQCDKPAFYEMENGLLLCIDCNLKVQDIADRVYARNAATLNQLAGQMEATTGVSGVIPRFEIPQPKIHTGLTVHNIKIDNSVVGAINTGQIKNLNVALDNVQNAGSPELANALQKLTEAVLASSELSPDKKTSAIEHLSHIATQAALPKDKRQKAISTTIIEGLERIISVSSGLLGIWQIVKPLVEQLF
jgi:hypothetical protein